MLGHGDYRGPLPGLYMCGAGTHPGGGVTGAPGHNAAREILSDFRRFRLPAVQLKRHCPVLKRVHTRLSSRAKARLCEPIACRWARCAGVG